jgi:hypothetical protein
MNALELKLLEPLIMTIVGALTSWVLVWLKNLIQAKTGIAISDDQFDQAKKAVQQVEEAAMSGIFLGHGQAKTVEAVGLLQQAVPKLSNEEAQNLVSQAVAVLPNVGATAIETCRAVPTPEFVPKYMTP